MNASGNPHPFEAERFELHGEQLVVDYQQLRGTRALRRMSVVGADGELRFYVGGEIRAEETPAGTMVSVVTSFAFDGDTELLSVLLPDVNLSREPSAPIRTVGIRTVHRGHFGGPGFIDGALSTHEAVTLTGTASRDEPEDTPSGVRCEWSAWYNRMPGRDDPNLYVAGRCGFPSGSMTWTLEPDNEGMVDDPELVVLRFTVETPEVGTDDFVERDVTWSGDAGPGVKRVQIRGDADVEIEVREVV